ncbi:GDP-D-glucose phosphorylase 1 [Phlebotomus argentipes]|uniref:GDP-D-glucose phosphorylase 1 n=1 Tax=Phlebotomus argentipes TaxID=94469 RepID=UPI002893328F|nr:GDP-D-glucose phosphorylase 1 [Phlebotomus argentipes]
MMEKLVNFSAARDNLANLISLKWSEAESKENLFKYKLNVTKSKVLPGYFGFYVELNPQRTQLRRKPQFIGSITPKFNPEAFNFNKVNPDEVLFVLQYKESLVSFLINNSPLTRNHCLVCPDLAENRPQMLTEKSIELSLDLLDALGGRFYRIGYNSPGALASVNHLHLHVMLIERELYVERAPLRELGKSIYTLEDKYPTCGLCLIVRHADCAQQVSARVFRLVSFLCERNIPHNIFITSGAIGDEACKRILIFPRDNRYLLKDKELSGLNVAFCELCSYVPVGSEEIYNGLTEDAIVGKIEEEMGNIFYTIKDEIVDMFQ